MRAILCVLLSATLLFCLIALSPAQSAPPGAETAWWGLLCPGLFGIGEGEDTVTFVFPLLDWFGRALFGNA